MEKSYNFKLIESKWQSIWEKQTKQNYDFSKPKYYILEMFPYPSGQMHMGHVRNYGIGDVVARYKLANGFNVMHPMGWDAFGLPAENAAKEHDVHPKNWTYENINNMRVQFKRLGVLVDWEKEFATCDPEYYKHEQSIFIDFYNHGLAYKKESIVNWDPVEQTVLANEQVVDGKGWRSGAPIEQKKLNQWFLKITQFGDELLTSLDDLKQWPEKVKNMQHNWIGKSTGAEISFQIKNSSDEINIYTTRPETIFGASFIAISINHNISLNLYNKRKDIKEFIDKYQKNRVIEEKEGINTNIIAIHPITKKEIPVFITNYVLDYGKGAVFGCPAHDQRDFEFATKYQLPITQVIENHSENINLKKEAYEGSGTLINSDFLNGINSQDAKKEINLYLEKHNFGKKTTNYRLKDWGISRQRYWGAPIPMVICPKCGIVPEKKENLPVKLPENINLNTSGNPLASHPDWKYTKCPSCNNDAERETDTFDTFFESSWYFFRYATMPKTDAFDKTDIDYWLPVDQYIGGVEHAIMHLLYARFFTKALAKIGIISQQHKEPFTNLLTQGMICHKTYKTKDSKQWVFPEDVIKKENGLFEKNSNEEVIAGKTEKMSKSKKNIINPNYICNTYGADTARLFVLSDSPPVKDLEWSEEGIEGSYKFVKKIWNTSIYIKTLEKKEFDCNKFTTLETDFYSKLQHYVQQVSINIESTHLNKSIALNRELMNLIESNKNKISPSLLRHAFVVLIKMLKPFIPHISSEILEMLGEQNDSWPILDEKYLKNDETTIAIQILGKTRDTINVIKTITQDELLEKVVKLEKVDKYIKDKQIKKVIYVPGRIINIII